jgi:hypothetical protein
MDLSKMFPGEGEIESVAKAEQCEPAKLLLRAARKLRDRYVQDILVGIETLPEQELRSKGGKAAGLTAVLDMVEQAKTWVRAEASQEEEKDNE